MVHSTHGLQQCLCPAECGLCVVHQLARPALGPYGLWVQFPSAVVFVGTWLGHEYGEKGGPGDGVE